MKTRYAHAVITDETGNGRVTGIDRVMSIALGNVLQVRSHSILRDGAGTVHEIEFTDGGSAKVSYSHTGKLRGCEISKCLAIITDHVVILTMQTDPPPLNDCGKVGADGDRS